MKCCICNNEIPAAGDWTAGNSAEPLSDGRCCNACDMAVVVPARMREFVSRVEAMPEMEGGWSVVEGARHKLYCEVVDERGRSLAQVIPRAAIARLMAAAPEMLEVLLAAKGTIEYLLANSDNGPAENCIALIAAAIAKAEGRGE